MKIDYSSLPAHRAIVARNAAIVALAKARTTDAIRTTDPAHSHPMIYKRRSSARDTVLSAETTPRNPDMMGSANWSGETKSKGSFAAGASPEDLNDANKKFWDDMAANNMPERPESVAANETQDAINKIQRANDSFWKQQTAHQRTPARQWGKG